MAKLMVSMVITTMTTLLLLVMILSVDEGESVKCFRCESKNNNCNNPSLGKKNVSSCEGKYCLKSKASLIGISASARMCADAVRIESGCLHDTLSGVSTIACVCSTDYCNGSRWSASASLFLSIVMVTVAVALGSFFCPR